MKQPWLQLAISLGLVAAAWLMASGVDSGWTHSWGVGARALYVGAMMLGGLFGLVGSIHSIKALVDGDAEALSPIADGYFQWMATLMVAGLLAAIGSVLWGWPFE